MSINDLKSRMPEFAKDTKLNLGKLSEEGMPGLNESQIAGIALASAYATKHPDVIAAISGEFAPSMTDAEVNAAKAAASIMGMNNIYYRFVHLASDKEYGKMPANLRMNVIGNPGVEKVDFELMSLAVSAINGCGMCIDAHVHEVAKAGVSREGVQSSVRLAAILNAAAQSLVIAQSDAATGSAAAAA
jgi:alkyl hydroperoxide reductase subunit D